MTEPKPRACIMGGCDETATDPAHPAPLCENHLSNESERGDGDEGDDDDSSTEGDENTIKHSLKSSERVIPDAIKELDLWVLWDLNEKIPIAPWVNGHCYHAAWGFDDSDIERPETDYETVADLAEFRPQDLDHVYPFPEGDIPDQVGGTIILPEGRIADLDAFGDTPRRLMYIDFDDVRDPETGAVVEEARKLIERLDSYTELSSSGTGIHVLIWATLPRLENFNAVIRDLDGPGSIELYDQKRFFGGTWEHVEETPTEVNERQDVVNDLVGHYAGDDLHESAREDRYDSPNTQDSNGRDGPQASPFPPGHDNSGDGSGGKSPYYDVDLDRFARPSTVAKDTSSRKQGPHPVHGKTSGGDETSTNYNLDTGSNQWVCYAHGNSGGGPMEMAAVMQGTLDCSDAGAGALDDLEDVEFLKVCLYARDRLLGFTSDMKPPYRALVAVAELFDLPMSDADDGVLGRSAHKIAREIYDNIDVAAVKSGSGGN